MNKEKSLLVQLELVWWVFTALVAFAFVFPITSKIANYPFLLLNIIFILIFLTFGRYFLFLKHTFLAKRQKMKMVVFLLCIPLLMFLVNQLNIFQTLVVERGVESFIRDIPYGDQFSLANYIFKEMQFFGVGAIIVSILLPFRLLLSIWRVRNRGTV